MWHEQKSSSDLQRRFFATLVALSLLVWTIGPVSLVRADNSGTVTGTITEPNGTTGVCNASVTLRTSNWSYSSYASTGCSGSFTFTSVPAGTLKLDVWANHASYFNPDVRDVVVSDNQTTSLGSVTLLNPNVFGKLTKSDGTTPVSNTSVTIRTSDWSISKYSNTDSAGVFKQALSSNGTYTVEIYSSDSEESRPDNQTITYSGANVYLDGTNGSSVVKLQKPAMKGKVVLPDGTPAPYASVNLNDSNNITVQWASTDSTGVFKVDAVATGTYKLKISPPYTPAGLVGPDPITVSLTKGTTHQTYLTTPITLSAALKTISGKLTKSDGTTVTDGNVSAWQYMGGGSASATTNSAGQYTLTVGAGEWFLSVYPTWSQGSSPDWTYAKSPKKVSFTKSNAEAESATADFSVAKLSATLSVRVQYPNGTAVPSSDYYSVNAWSEGGGGNWCQVGSGSCSMKLPPGTFNLSVNGSSTQYGTPSLSPLTLKDNESYEMTITLLERNSTIAGYVRNTKGQGISGQSVNAWQEGGFGWGWGNTDSNGKFSLAVTAGKWCVNSYPSQSAAASNAVSILSTSTSYVSTDEPKCVTVSANGSTEANFTFEIADATVSGVVVDKNNTTLSSVYGWVQASKTTTSSTTSNFYFGGVGGSINSGSFTIRVPAGTWELCASLGYSGDYTTADCVSVTVSSGDVKNDVKLTLVPSNATITGYFRNASGDIITDVFGSVFAQKNVAYRWSSIDSGGYSFKVAAGTWKLGCWVDPSTASQYYLEGTCDKDVTVAENETKRQDIFLKVADSTITVKTVDPDGKPLANALINIDTSFGAAKTISYSQYGAWFNRNKATDQNGMVSLKVPAGTYFVTASIDPGLGYINPEKEVATVAADSPAALTLKFVKPDATISGTVTVEGAKATGTFVAASTSDGGYVETQTTEGTYALKVTGGETWTVVAADETDTSNKGYREGMSVEVAKGSTTAAPTIVLGDGKTEDAASLPEAISVTTATNAQLSMTDQAGASLTIPANTLTADNVTVSVTIEPTVELPDTATSVPATLYGYDLDVRQTSGQNAGQTIKTFVADATVCIPYSETEITADGLAESDLTMQYFDETAGTYRDVKTSTVNATENKVCGTTNHSSKFVLTSTPLVKKTTTPGTPAAPGQDGGGGGTDEAPVVTPELTELTTKQLAALALQKGVLVVSIYNRDGTRAKSFKPYVSRQVTGAFRLVAADVTGSGTEALAVYPVSGQSLPVKVMNLDGKTLGSFTPFGGQPIAITAADIDGDKKAELIVTAKTNASALIYGYSRGKVQRLLTISRPAGSSGGLLVGVGNVTGGESKELIFANPASGKVVAYAANLTQKRAARVATASSSILPKGVKEIHIADVTGSRTNEVLLRGSETATLTAISGKSFKRLTNVKVSAGVTLRLGDVTGDSKADFVVVNPTTGKLTLASYEQAKKRVRVLSTGATNNQSIDTAGSVSIGDLDADGQPELTVAQKNGSRVKVYRYENGKLRAKSSYSLKKASGTNATLLASDLNGDGRREIVAVPSTGTKVSILTFKQDKLSLSKQFTVSGRGFGSGLEVTAATVE
ncbi:MAG: carboxypeptidase regulatory-like domain-containing protein [Candidatus Kerfeldbacteria bacterium]|nr:carboxypeptidase regulatory-like domain-containing protein [Candidatus Kerfeldbacteria bacterium]